MNAASRELQTESPACRFCSQALRHTFVDLGMSPLCETLIRPEQLNDMEPFFPLHTYVCERCFLVQLEEYVVPGEIFASDYPYFSSYSDTWVAHARDFVEQMIGRLRLSPESLVIEIASNDGYLLQHLVARGIPVVGIEPAHSVAAAAREKGIPTEETFFGRETAKEIAIRHGRPKLLVGNNVLAHVPDLNDFVAGMKHLLAADGVITMEFPHLLQLMRECQFDTIYHEHFSYLSLGAVSKVFEHHGLRLFDVQQLPTHGGSLRIFARHAEHSEIPVEDSVAALLERERAEGLEQISTYSSFASRVIELKRDILDFLIRAKREGKSVVGYGAPGKGNTLLNYCGIRNDFLDYTVDRNPYKHGCYTPGCRIPIYPPERIRETQPDFLFILPWNLTSEIISQTAYIRDWGGRWVTPIPTVRIHD